MSQVSIASLPEFDLTGARTKITSPVGPRGGGTHWGTDQGSDDGVDIGTPVHARLDGKVVHYQYDGPFRPPNGHTAGHNLWFQADNGRRFKCFHLAGPPVVPVGQWVAQGTIIARVGNSGTGIGNYNAHLHEEEHSGSWSNPINGTPDIAACYAQRRFASTAGEQLPPITEPEPPEEYDMHEPMPAYEMSDGSVYSTDGLTASWLFGGAVRSLLHPPDAPTIKLVATLNAADSADFIRSFEGSRNIPIGSADAYAKNNPA